MLFLFKIVLVFACLLAESIQEKENRQEVLIACFGLLSCAPTTVPVNPDGTEELKFF